MTFQEIFNEKGRYRADGFADGYCLEVDEDGVLYGVLYEDREDFLPRRHTQIMYKGLFDKDYFQVLNKNQLFK